jgi:hypothetical protein
MDQAEEFDYKDPAPYPTNCIFAVFDEHNRARRTLSLLNEEIFVRRKSVFFLVSRALRNSRRPRLRAGCSPSSRALAETTTMSKHTGKLCLRVSLYSQLPSRASICGTTSHTYSNHKGHVSLSSLAALPSRCWKAKLGMPRTLGAGSTSQVYVARYFRTPTILSRRTLAPSSRLRE